MGQIKKKLLKTNTKLLRFLRFKKNLKKQSMLFGPIFQPWYGCGLISQDYCLIDVPLIRLFFLYRFRADGSERQA